MQFKEEVNIINMITMYQAVATLPDNMPENVATDFRTQATISRQYEYWATVDHLDWTS